MTGLGVKLNLPADEVKPGDFTLFSGFRRVVEVRATSPGPSAVPGRNHKLSLPRVAFVRTGREGDSERVDRVHRVDLVTVFRKAV